MTIDEIAEVLVEIEEVEDDRDWSQGPILSQPKVERRPSAVCKDGEDEEYYMIKVGSLLLPFLAVPAIPPRTSTPQHTHTHTHTHTPSPIRRP